MGVGFETEEGEGLVRVVLSGELDVASAPDVEKRLLELESGELPPRLVLDLTALRFIDSTGLSLLINADRRARQAGWRLTVVSGSGAPRRILDTTGLHKRLEIVEQASDVNGA